MKYNAESGQLIVLVNDAKGDYYKVHTRADGTTWMTVLKLEVSVSFYGENIIKVP